MTIQEAPAYITTVNDNRTVTLPDSIPVGATIAVVVVKNQAPSEEQQSRKAHFAAALAALREVEGQTPPVDSLSDEELSSIIERARKHL